jgi:hypothetical protein
MRFEEIASWLESWLMRLCRAVEVPDMASEQSLEQHQRPDDGVVSLMVVVRVLSGIAYVEVYVSWYVQSTK